MHSSTTPASVSPVSACPALLLASALALLTPGADAVFAPYCGCPGDLNGDQLVNGSDLGWVLAAWGPVAGPVAADVNGDGVVDGADLGLVLSSWGACPPPANDSCADAVEVFSGDTFTLCTTNATTDGPSVIGCGTFASQIHKDIWFVYNPPGNGTLQVNNCSQVAWDSIIAIYDATSTGYEACPSGESPGFLQLVGCNDDYPGCDDHASLVNIPVYANHTYKIRVGGYLGASGVGTMTVAGISVGPTCQSGIPVVGIPGVTQVVSGSTLDNPLSTAPCISGQSKGEWITYTPTCNLELVRLSTCNLGTNFDTVLAVWRETPGNCTGALETCVDDTNEPDCSLNGLPRKSKAEFLAQGGKTYHILVAGYNAQKAGAYVLSIDTECIVP